MVIPNILDSITLHHHLPSGVSKRSILAVVADDLELAGVPPWRIKQQTLLGPGFATRLYHSVEEWLDGLNNEVKTWGSSSNGLFEAVLRLFDYFIHPNQFDSYRRPCKKERGRETNCSGVPLQKLHCFEENSLYYQGMAWYDSADQSLEFHVSLHHSACVQFISSQSFSGYSLVTHSKERMVYLTYIHVICIYN